MKHSEQLNEIGAALAKAQAKMEGVKKDKTNPYFKSKYADLNSCMESCREALSSEGLSIIQANVPHEGGVMVQTRILHASGQWLEEEGLFVPAAKADPQGFGSALTYARRYSLCAMVGLAPEDDDGNSAAKAVQANTPTAGLWEALSAEDQNFLNDLANEVIQLIARNDVEGAIAHLDEKKLSADEKAGIWTRFDSKQRAALKKATKKE